MSKELNCMNCCIGDFKDSLCDCNNGMCKEYKKVGKSEDFEKELLKRTKPKTGEWIVYESKATIPPMYKCSNCQKRNDEMSNYCPNCGAIMVKGGDEE